MKRILITIGCIVMIFGETVAQTAESQQAEIAAAIALANGSNGKFNRPKAYAVLKSYAEQGNARAMNGLGLMYLLSYIDNVSDTVNAVKWLEKAGEAGYPSAYENMGCMYKYARGGVKQDLAKAFYYFDKAAQAGAISGQYSAGYMLYKGLGCEQNYEKAFAYFTDAAQRDHSPAMYMLGLCYRNGYGVEKNEGESQYWLATADRLGYTFATEELEKEMPESLPESQQVNMLRSSDIPAQFQKIDHLDKGERMDGTYEGVLVVYDWSGTTILKETPLTLRLATEGEAITGEWIENGNDTAQIFAIRQADGLRFIETRQYRVDHYTTDSPVLFSFEKAEIQFSSYAGSASLVGNIQMYSPETMEPERPMYLSLRRTNNDGDLTGLKNVKNVNDVKPMRAYPVPFANELNIVFMQTETAEVGVGIYNTEGKCVYFYTAGRLPDGEHHLTLTPTLTAGTYIVRLTAGKRTEQTVIIRSGRTKK